MSKLAKRIALFCVAYVLVGTCLGFYRHGGGSGGYESLFRLILYPVAWPHFEVERLQKRAKRAQWKENRRDGMLAAVCPLGHQELFRRHFLNGGPLPSYRGLAAALTGNPPLARDIRRGYSLYKLSEAAAGEKGVDVLEDAAALLKPGADMEALMSAAAIARGAFLRYRDAAGESAAAQRSLVFFNMEAAYEDVLASVSPVELPYASLAVGTVHEAASRVAAPEEEARLANKARAEYMRAVDSGKDAASFPAAVLAARLARDDRERAAILSRLLSAPEPQEKRFDEDLLTGFDRWDVDGDNRAEAAARFLLGKSLFPILDSGIGRIMMESAEQHGWTMGQAHERREFIVLFALVSDDFSARLEMVESFLHRLLPSNADILGKIRDSDESTILREVYYRLYDETGDGRWLTAAVESPVRLRPALRKFESFFAAEAAFLRGEYRSHFLLGAQHLVQAADASGTSEGHSEYVRARMRGKRIMNAPDESSQHYEFRFSLFLEEVARRLRGDENGEKRRKMAEKIGKAEWPVESYEFTDADVTNRE